MKNKMWILGIILLILGIGAFLFFSNQRKQNDQTSQEGNYEASKSSTENNMKEEVNRTEEIKNNEQSNETKNTIVIGATDNENIPPKEEQISTFSTKIYTQDSARQTNISITCSTLNDTIVKNGETFSFCNTIGPASSQKGYQEADIFDNDGKKKKGLRRRKLPDK